VPKRRLLGALAALVLITLSTAGFSASKDVAVVIGVDQVAGIPSSLKGAANDAKDFADQLRHRGVDPVVLIDGQATRAAIASAIARGAKADHLIVYFAGYGSGPNTPRIMTSEDNKGLPLEDLDKTLLKAGAGSTTVILDTSFAGLRAEKDGPSLFTSRYYQPPAVSSRALESIGANAADLPGLSHDKICYITAGRFNENAFEDTINGKTRGVFTNYLCDRLANTQGAVAWQTIQWDVAAQVAAHVDDQQHPNFPTEYLANAALEGDVVAPAEYGKASEPAPNAPNGPVASIASPQHRTLWTLFNVDNVDPRMVALSMKPNKAEVAVQESLEFELKVGRPGYLVVVEHSVEGTLMPIFPRDGNIETARVRAGQNVVIPEPGVMAYADRTGKERLKALLFDDAAAAEALLQGLDSPTGDAGSTFGNASKRLQGRGIKFARSAPEFGRREDVSDIPVTADLTFRVVER
jgi:hypothetical protein